MAIVSAREEMKRDIQDFIKVSVDNQRNIYKPMTIDDYVKHRIPTDFKYETGKHQIIEGN